MNKNHHSKPVFIEIWDDGRLRSYGKQRTSFPEMLGQTFFPFRPNCRLDKAIAMRKLQCCNKTAGQ